MYTKWRGGLQWANGPAPTETVLEHNKQTPPWGPRLQRSDNNEILTPILSTRLYNLVILYFNKPLTMDIDDILRQVDPRSRGVPTETRDLQALTRLWVAERSAPELLE